MARIALPRDLASTVIVRGVAAAERSAIVVGMVLTMFAITAALLHRGGDLSRLPLAIVALLLVCGLAIHLMIAPSALRAGIFLGAGAVISTVYVVTLLEADANLTEPSPFLVNRIAVALILVGAVTGSARNGILWTVIGFIVGQASLLVGFAIAGHSGGTGFAPILVFVVAIAVYGAFEAGSRRLRRQVSDIDALEAELAVADRQRELEQRASRLAHDTVLADLAIIAARPGPLDEAARARLERDVAVARAGLVAPSPSAAPSRSRLSAELLQLASDYQWSGVRVDVSGGDELDVAVDDDAWDAVIGAIRAALDNVVRHAGSERAEVVVGVRNDTLSVLVVDDGVGFVPDDVDDDRLGVRSSIHDRVRAVGGSVRVWSGDEGTTVMLAVPIRSAGEQA